jgi:hypothetical protein
LNAANVLSAGLLLQVGLSRLAPTHDLDAQQICSMATLLNDFGGKIDNIVLITELVM